MTKKTAAKAAAEPAQTEKLAGTQEAGGEIAASAITATPVDQLTTSGSAGVIAPLLIHPTVGRKVWYRPGPQDRHSHMQWIDGEPLDATILAVHGDRCINAQVLDINGTAFVRRSWPLVQPGDEAPDGSYFEWMPYQTGQAAKAA